jgi:hypothetical protein
VAGVSGAMAVMPLRREIEALAGRQETLGVAE